MLERYNAKRFYRLEGTILSADSELSDAWRDASSVQDIKTFLKNASLEPALVPWLNSDRRSGVRQLGSRVSRQLQRRDDEDRRLKSILVRECDLQMKGYRCIGGVDEVGAGPLAGPVVAAAVIVDPEHPIRGVKDSKKLSAKERARIERDLLDSVVAAALGWVSPAEIDDLNIYQASLTAMKRAVEGLQPSADFLLVDARTIPDIDIPQMPIIGGDNLSYAIAAASILAKEARDRYMVELDAEYPNYGFAGHKGYGTAQHLAALNRDGPCPHHRRSFAPVAAALR